jgi:hypothetical protein
VATLSQTKLKRFIEAPKSMKSDPDYPIFEAGVEEGKRLAKKQALDFLQEKYMDEDVMRGSVEGRAILQVTRELSEALK